MKKIARVLLKILSALLILIAITAFIIKDPSPDYLKNDLTDFDHLSITNLATENSKIGNFKSSVNFNQRNSNALEKEFYGQEIRIHDNPKLDRILIGVTNNLISRIEIWNKNELVEAKELGFMEKMTWGETLAMSVAFYDQTNTRYPGKSKITMRFYSGSGFFGDIGIINLDLSDYGNLNGEKEISLFAKTLDSEKVNQPKFTDLKVWKNFKSFG
ncbi:hypothetical protein G3O08_10040 [Cryomorpha ignava]|uniref:Uncharacterized protein n=1 Tax=Cryomorpha ignava TaxID=101383 RepID=A0A7K3WS06_9FLAO|nr:hypothetical protein [Cryomorpha ignava]NEN23841.1 hypothetical protein [Cryomorpha ignava]